MRPVFVTLLCSLLAIAPRAKAARGIISEEDRRWWAFQPVGSPPVPSIKDAAWTKNEVDFFVLAKLEANSLRPSPEAGRGILIRRLTFDLTGLPPTPDEVREFVSDVSPDAYVKLVDRLLASPRYGERYARHWLDLVRYADSDGYKADDFRPNAWRYRDYVIRSLNADKPYSQFVREQLAGDEIAPDEPDALIATGYLRHWIYEYNNRDVVGQWTTILNDVTDTTADVFLGLGLQCARCHDHKYDPLLQKDYFRLQAIFAPMLPVDGTVVAATEMKAAHAAKLAEWEKQTAPLREEISRIEESYRATAQGDAASKFPEETQAILRKPETDRTPIEKQLGDLAWRQVLYEFDHLEGRIKGTDKERMVELRKQLAAFDKLKPESLPVSNTVRDQSAIAPEVRIPKKTEIIAPGVPTILDAAPLAATPRENSTGRRTAFADWLVRPENPLTARVIVNRVWAWHFGQGLAAVTSDFGRLGEKPSHPDLLDWLTRRFIDGGWSLKKLHRLIVTSATYRQNAASSIAEEARMKDPENRMLWRWNTHRLGAEQIRDALLAATGELDLTAGGPPVDFTKPRRSVYNKVLRNVRDPLLDVFDAPQHFNSTATRDTTTTAVQSLLLANNRALLERAEALAKRLRRDFPNNKEAQIRGAFRLTYGRDAASDELNAAASFLKEQEARLPSAQAAEQPFLAEQMPQRDGKAAVLSPGAGQERLCLSRPMARPEADFAIEAVALLRSIYENGDVRVLASAWNGDKASPGWALGVTGKKSQRKPQMLVLQLVGAGEDGKIIYEPVFSDLQLQLDRSYFVAASIHPGAMGEGKVSFFIKDLSNDDQPMQTTSVPHPITGGYAGSSEIVIGGRAGEKSGHQWDGLIDEVRIRRGQLQPDQCFFQNKSGPLPPEVVACWQFEPKSGFLFDSASGQANLQPSAPPPKNTPAEIALTDLCHMLFNSSEFLYVE